MGGREEAHARSPRAEKRVFRARFFTVWMVWIGWLFSCGALEAADVVALPTNVDLLVEAVQRTVDDALGSMQLAADPMAGPVLLVAETRHQGNWLVEHVLMQRLLDRGFSVLLDSTGRSGDLTTLSYRVLDLRVEGNSGLLRDAIHRRAHATLALRMSRDALLTWQQECTATVEDQIPKSRADLLDIDRYRFAKVDLKIQTWGQFVEPVVVSSVLGGLIYTFFSKR